MAPDQFIYTILSWEILEGNKIPHMVRSFHDSAYDGIFQNQYVWGVLEADESDEVRILDLIKDL
jgi:hypothetical protein